MVTIKNIIFDIGGVVVIKGKFNIIMKWMAKMVFGTINQEFFKEEHVNTHLKKEWQLWRTGKLNAQEFLNRQRKNYHL